MPLPKNLSAKFAVGDRVRLQAGVTWTVIGRYWRPRNREVVYDLKATNPDYVTRQPEHRIFPAPKE